MRIEIDPDGPRNAKIAFVGEAPGLEEMAATPKPRPFVGPAGRELMNELQRVGVRRDDCFVTNIIRYKLPKNNFAPLYVDSKGSKPTEELLEAWEYLEKELKEVNPNVIVPLGNYALHAITGLHGIGKWRGSIVKSKWGAKCVPTYHPSGIIQNWDARPLALLDLRKAKRESTYPQLVLPKENLIIRPSLEQTVEYIRECRKRGRYVLDVETLKYYYLLCTGLSYGADTAISIPFYKEDEKEYWSSIDLKIVKEELNGLYSDENVEAYAQNGAYDSCWLLRKGYKAPKLTGDTLVMQHAAWSEMPKDLGTLISIYTNRPYHKDENKNWNRVQDWDRLWYYNCRDCIGTFDCIDPLQGEINATETRSQYEFEMSLVPIFVDLTMKGINFDKEKRDLQKKAIGDKIKEKLKDLWTFLPQGVNYCKKCGGKGEIGKKKVKPCPECAGLEKYINHRSPAQLKQLIYTDLKLPKSAMSKKMGTDKDTLLKLQVKTKHAVIQTLLDLSELEELYEMVGMKCDQDERIRTTLGCTTETGRLASSKGPWGTGRNLQNIHRKKYDSVKYMWKGEKKPVNIREVFRADPGYTIIGADYSQAEVRVVAYESTDARLIKVFEDNGDIHTQNAKAIFQKEEINNEERQVGKRICHACDYGISPRGIVDVVLKDLGPEYAISEKEARQFQLAYFSYYPDIKRFQDLIQNEIMQHRTIYNSFGRKRVYLGRPSGKSLRELVAHVPQSTVADLTNRAMKEVYYDKRLTEYDAQLLLQLHDALYIQVPDDLVKVCIPIIKGRMSFPLKAYYSGFEYNIPIDFKIGPNLGEMKEVKV